MKNNLVVDRQMHNGQFLLVFIDTKKSSFMGMTWEKLGEWGKRKCENFLVLSRLHDKQEYVKIIYV